jgi:hypothetical protein
VSSAPDTGQRVPTVGDRAFWLDALTIVVVSVAIAFFAQRLLFMTIFVPAVVLLRFVEWARLSPEERGGALAPEIVFFLVCTLLGGFNDWNSVVNHQIYDYTVPHYFPGFSSIPIWMLLFWGMILRFLVTLFRWKRLSPAEGLRNTFRFSPRELPALKVATQLALVLITRQFIYRLWGDPVLSWLPFLVAFGVYWTLFRMSRHDWVIVGLFLLGGPLIEVLYIQVGGLHRYHLGWLGGVPLWIALWWIVAALVWSDLAARLQRRLASALSSLRSGEAAAPDRT